MAAAMGRTARCGGEVLVATCAAYERVGHLGWLVLPGGEQAVRQPWRVAAAALAQLYGPDFWRLALPFTQQLDQAAWQVLARMIERNLNSPRTSSLGRLFDAAAALAGMGQIARYEGELAILFEQIADPQQPPYPMRCASRSLPAGRSRSTGWRCWRRWLMICGPALNQQRSQAGCITAWRRRSWRRAGECATSAVLRLSPSAAACFKMSCCWRHWPMCCEPMALLC